MDYIHPIQIGEILRKRRKEMGLRLEDLADDFISPSTISNIERGITYVNEDKVRYVAEKLNINLDQIHDLIAKEKQEEAHMELQLAAIENMIDLMSPDKGLERLRKLDVPNNHLLSAIVHFLRGKIYLQKRNWVKAQNHFLEAIRIVDQKEEWLKTNIKAASYHELSRIAFSNHDPGQALRYVNEGLEHFQAGGERAYYIYILEIARITYLNELDHIEEALRRINQIWDEIHHIKSIEVVLELYKVRISILRKLKLYEEAIAYAHQGIEVARINKKTEQSCELWSRLGTIYLLQHKWEEAENCFRTALSLQEKIKSDHMKIKAHTYLGLAYLEQDKDEAAAETLLEALAISDRTPHPEIYRESYILMGDCYVKQGNTAEAIKIYEKALKMAQKKKDYEQERKIVLKLARCFENADKQKFQIYLEQLYKLDIREHAKMPIAF
ncbi:MULTISPECIES: tetratricopeptide repeat protein [unclassified Thermoactinomyces]|jgi:tetratricopeptide (TPR) repeat protein|uniref:helix-turn-helix domain-containing protein n=1 Tax=unclassified Thermoactinomyces TaxID=2634588 RepID=UPI0018DBB2F0|nr:MULTISPECIES: tetratricopeptide repeat protein [unclassified Thermoactinomyces]MBH8598014.1 tetratricopeptide repeat protein [Thermoactinomyces sp. CICC 10523]MBH8603045.1 tetratricopeptide repeat protein [Thermoactinomyces sp. CICC 10522]MBH8609240.1 tetratricopeptide repeat protein [Thermoactinomyces sp. CICC 10521]